MPTDVLGDIGRLPGFVANLPGFAQIGQLARQVADTTLNPAGQAVAGALGAAKSPVANAPGIAQIGQARVSGRTRNRG